MFHSLLPFEDEAVNLYRGEKRYIKYRLLSFIYRLSMRNAEGLLFSSSFTEKKFLSYLSSEIKPGSKVIPFGTWSSFSSVNPSASISDDKTVRCIYVSNFYKYKRHLMLIPLFEELIRAGYDVSLTLCGDSYAHERDKMEAVNASEYRERIRYIGKHDHAEMQELYRSHDLLMFPSMGESFGIPLIEASYENLWILFSWPPLVEIMQNNQYERYTLADQDISVTLKELLKSHAAGVINLKEKKTNTHFIPFTRTASETMHYLESYLPETN